MSYWDGSQWVQEKACQRPKRGRSVLGYATGAIAEGTLLAMLVLTLAAGTAFAKGPGGGKPGSGSLTIPDGTFGSTTTATANSGTAGTWVMAECFQNDRLVYRQYVPVEPATHQATLTLGPTPSWSGGAASCRGEEGIWFKGTRWRVLAATTFHVSG